VISNSDFICVAAAVRENCNFANYKKCGKWFDVDLFVLLCPQLTAETKGMIGEKELAHAKSDAVLINVGRGPLIDEEALIVALQDKTIRGAALDVFSREPLPSDSPLWDMDNVLLSPHNADMTATFLHNSVKLFCTSLKGFIDGEPVPMHIVDKRSGY
jgi:phosphoglycerate dehydrogenase-like enzyme